LSASQYVVAPSMRSVAVSIPVTALSSHASNDRGVGAGYESPSEMNALAHA
jgi:hypothetical protein